MIFTLPSFAAVSTAAVLPFQILDEKTCRSLLDTAPRVIEFEPFTVSSGSHTFFEHVTSDFP